jgi:hypothetical protein
LKNGELVIAVTVRTFPFALDEIRADTSPNGRRFAVIADEEHSSQSGQIPSKLRAVLTAEEAKAIEEGGEVDVEAILASEMTERAESEKHLLLRVHGDAEEQDPESEGCKLPSDFQRDAVRPAWSGLILSRPLSCGSVWTGS